MAFGMLSAAELAESMRLEAPLWPFRVSETLWWFECHVCSHASLRMPVPVRLSALSLLLTNSILSDFSQLSQPFPHSFHLVLLLFN